jgi:DNA polymerase III epsilon subunit-like protein
MKVLVFDTETTGLPEKEASIYDKSKWPYIIQLSYILYDLSNNSSLIKNNFIKIDESVIITQESTNIHNISREILNAQGINIVPALKEFNECLKKCDIVVGHNISFDKRLIFVECLRHNIKQYFTQFVANEKIHKPEFCTMKNTAQFCKLERLSKTNQVYNKMPKLSELYTLLFPNEPLPKDLHNSLIDVAMTLRCYVKYVYNKDIIDNSDAKNNSIINILL